MAENPNAVEVDLGTNSQTHDKPVVNALRNFLKNRPKPDQTATGRQKGIGGTD
jgi:hypothetical protein